MNHYTTITQQTLRFDGPDVNAADVVRLTGQLLRVRDLMLDGEWRTLGTIQAIVGGSEAALSARLRDLRKARFGGYQVNRRRVSETRGLWEYQVI